jgi:hypothetical protein
MPLNAAEKVDVAKSLLQCFGEDINPMGRTLAYLTQFTVGQVNLLATVQSQALTWQPFIDAGLSIDPGYIQEIQRVYDQTIYGITS